MGKNLRRVGGAGDVGRHDDIVPLIAKPFESRNPTLV